MQRWVNISSILNHQGMYHISFPEISKYKQVHHGAHNIHSLIVWTLRERSGMTLVEFSTHIFCCVLVMSGLRLFQCPDTKCLCILCMLNKPFSEYESEFGILMTLCVKLKIRIIYKLTIKMTHPFILSNVWCHIIATKFHKKIKQFFHDMFNLSKIHHKKLLHVPL